MTTRIILEVTFKNGFEFKELVQYAYVKKGELYAGLDKKISTLISERIIFTLEKIESFEVYPVLCEGWTLLN